MDREVTEFLAYKATERGLTPRTIEAYRHDLAKFGQFVAKETGSKPAIAEIDQYTIKAYLQFLANTGIKKSNATVTRGRKLATLKSFFKYLASEGKVKSDPTSQVKMPKVKRKEPSYLTEQEYKRLLRTVQKNATKYFKQRDVAIIQFLVGAGYPSPLGEAFRFDNS